jgi:general secretion pathway protein D
MLPSTLASLLLAALPALPVLQDPVPGEIQVPEGVVEQDEEYITLKFDETEQGLTLAQFVKIAQKMTGRNFTIDDSTAGGGASGTLQSKNLLLYGPKRIRRENFYAFFQIMMKINGFVIVRQGSGDLAVEVITLDNVQTRGTIKTNGTFVEVEDVEGFADQPATYIITVYRLRHGSAQSLGVNLRTALGSGGSGGGNQDAFMPLPTENALLVQGFGPFVAAAVRMLEILDVEPFKVQPEFERLRLQEASAEELAQTLTDLLENFENPAARNTRQQAEGAAQEEIETRILANPRDNSLLVVASKERMEMVKNLVAKLDSKVEIPETNFRVYLLQNISATDLQEDLKKFLDRTRQAEEQTARNTQGSTQRRIEQQIVVESQEETNSLLITATRTKWDELRRLLDRLDQRQPQVLIETALIEVTEEFSKDIGVELATVDPPAGDYAKGFGFTSVGISTLIDSDGDNQVDTRLVDTGAAGFTAGILDGADFGIPLLLRAAKTSSNANILSIPSILVTNNRGARVESKDEIPTSEQTPVASVGVTETFRDYQEAGIKLSITPSISGKHYLRLGINLEISAFVGTFTPGSTVPPPRVTRTLETTVYLPDGATMWIGGIIRDDMILDETGIPWLSDIPVLGWIFSRRQDSNTKTTLYFFCTPRILDDFDELADLSEGGKARAADVIGLDRVQRVDPEFRLKNPLDMIQEQDLDGDGAAETGYLDPSGFEDPVFVSSQGVADPAQVRVDGSATPAAPLTRPAPTAGARRNLPEDVE